MNRNIAALLAGIVVLCLIFVGCGKDRPSVSGWKPPAGGLVSTGTASMFYLRTAAGTVLVYYDGELSANTSHNSNAAERSFDYSGALTTGDGAKLFYGYVSTDVDVITFGDFQYNLAEGLMFEMTDAADVRQSTGGPEPFVDSHEYLGRLKAHFGRGGE